MDGDGGGILFNMNNQTQTQKIDCSLVGFYEKKQKKFTNDFIFVLIDFFVCLVNNRSHIFWNKTLTNRKKIDEVTYDLNTCS